MAGINTLLDIGNKSLFASQTAIQVTGQNIANVNTEGYHRRTLRLEEAMAINYRPGQLGTGVNATEVIRHFDRFVENTYNDKSSEMQRWQNQFKNLQGVESLFNESSSGGLSATLAKFFSDWQGLANDYQSSASRQTLVDDTQNLLAIMRQADNQMEALQRQANEYIQQDVDEVNRIIENIASLNKQINTQDIPGQNNVNELYDKRDMLVRDLAEKIDVTVIDKGTGDMTVLTKAGHTLVDGSETYEIKYESPKTVRSLTNSSSFDGSINFEGSDDYEYYFEVAQSGVVSNASPSAMLRVSLDGGRTFLKDDDGKDLLVPARPESSKVKVRGLTIWFGQQGDSSATPLNQMEKGDKFVVVPKSGIYWYEDTNTAENITPQICMDGTDNNRRVVGGSLAGYFNFRDDAVGRYKEKFDTLAQTIIWEVNRIHSTGAGLSNFSQVEGTYAVKNDNAALASGAAGLPFGDRLSSGSSMIYVYDSASGELASSATLDFDPTTPGQQNFDPDQHNLNDVMTAINTTFSGSLTATIVNHKIKIESADGKEFAFGPDTSGVYAALGLNTFFDGDSASSIAVNNQVGSDLDHINTGHVNGAGEVNHGDNSTAFKVGQLQDKKVDITTVHTGTMKETISGFYNTIVASVGADTAASEFNAQYQHALAQDLDRRQQEVGGVNLDQEMSDLIKFQHSYTAAAKLISTADQMLQTLLGLKQ
jgi:flagellar hook-associated protein 1 FlgK